jgi:alcohol dehydrogenase
MKALIYNGLGKMALEDRPKPEITAPTDAIVRMTKTAICGTDLHIIKSDVPTCEPGRILGHEGALATFGDAAKTKALKVIITNSSA